jgi:hypothetical protein
MSSQQAAELLECEVCALTCDLRRGLLCCSLMRFRPDDDAVEVRSSAGTQVRCTLGFEVPLIHRTPGVATSFDRSTRRYPDWWMTGD